jgi:hypothetical protein
MDKFTVAEEAYQKGFADGEKSLKEKIAQLEQELKDERYRHDRLQDFEVAEAEQLRQLKERSRWIPVTERLPDLIPCSAGTAYSEAVIVWTSGRKAMIAVWDGIDFLCAADFWEAWGENITHWMPLPEVPVEVQCL